MMRPAKDQFKASGKHPIAAVEKRVLDSEAFAALPASAVKVLLLLARNLEKNRNGHIYLPPEQAEKCGISRKTFYRSLKTLTAHGIIFPTKRGGNGECGLYALTWLPLSKDTKALHLGNYQDCAWRHFGKKAKGKNVQQRGHFYPFDPGRKDKNTSLQGTFLPSLNCIPIPPCKDAWIPAELRRLAECGLAGRQCFRISSPRTLQ